MTTPAELLAAARALLKRTDPKTAGLWPRAAALLARQALEGSLDMFWRSKKLSFDPHTGRRQQFLCLHAYLEDRELAGLAHNTWATLSDASHHHAYELAPTVGEVEALIKTAEGFALGNP